MALLGRRQDDEDDDLGGDALALNLDDLVCPTCGRDLPPWVTACPDDGATPVERAESKDSRVPDIPEHLLDGLDDLPAPGADEPDNDPDGVDEADDDPDGGDEPDDPDDVDPGR